MISVQLTPEDGWVEAAPDGSDFMAQVVMGNVRAYIGATPNDDAYFILDQLDAIVRKGAGPLWVKNVNPNQVARVAVAS